MKSKKGSYRDPVPEIGTHWDSADWGILEVLLTHFTEKNSRNVKVVRRTYPPLQQRQFLRSIFFKKQKLKSENLSILLKFRDFSAALLWILRS